MSLLPLLLFVFLSCGSSQVGEFNSVVQFEPNPAPMSASLCQSHARLVSISNQSVTLVSLDVVFQDASQTEIRVTLDTEQLQAVFTQVVLPGYGTLEGDLSFNLGGVASPAEGTVVIVGSGVGGTTIFSGELVCQAP